MSRKSDRRFELQYRGEVVDTCYAPNKTDAEYIFSGRLYILKLSDGTPMTVTQFQSDDCRICKSSSRGVNAKTV